MAAWVEGATTACVREQVNFYFLDHTYGHTEEAEMGNLESEALGVVFPGQAHASPVPLNDARLDHVVAHGLNKAAAKRTGQRKHEHTPKHGNYAGGEETQITHKLYRDRRVFFIPGAPRLQLGAI